MMLDRLDKLIAEGRAIEAAIVTIPGRWTKNWITNESRQGPPSLQLDWPRFVKWRTDVSTLLGALIPAEHRLAYLAEDMRTLSDTKDSLQWAIAQLDSIRESHSIGLFNIVTPKPPALHRVLAIIDRFHHVARQLEHRHAGRRGYRIKDEYDVQDLLHALLRLDFDDVREEEWTPSHSGKAARMDLVLKAERIVVEVKMTRDGLAERELGDQLLLDIARYKHRDDCESLVCFIYDPQKRLKNATGLTADLEKAGTADLRIAVRVV